MKRPKRNKNRKSVQRDDFQDFESDTDLDVFVGKRCPQSLFDLDIFNPFDFKPFNEDFFDNFKRLRKGRNSTLPKINMEEEGNKYFVEIGIPGYDKDEVNLSIKDNALVIKGKNSNRCRKQGQDGRYMLRELSGRAFHRVIPFPKQVDADSVEAKYRNGIIFLSVTKEDEDEEDGGKEIKF